MSRQNVDYVGPRDGLFSGYKTFKTASALIFFFFLENGLHEV